MTIVEPAELRRITRLLTLVALVSSLDRFIVAPMLSAIATDMGVGLGRAAAAATWYFLAYGAMQPVWGVVCDRLGRVRTLRLGLLLSAVFGLASAAAPSLGMLVTGRALAGACFGAAVPAVLVYIGDTVPWQSRQAAMTDVISGVALGTALAAATGGLAANLGWRWGFGSTAVLAAVLFVRLGRLSEPADSRREPVRVSFRVVLTNRWSLLVIALVWLEGFVLLGLFTFVPSALEHSGSAARTAGLVASVFGVAVLAAAKVVKRLASSDRRRTTGFLTIGGLSGVFGCAVLASRQSVASAVLGCVLLGVGWASMHSSLQAWITEVTPDARATAVAFFAASLFAGGAAGGGVGGVLAGRAAYTELFGLGGLLFVPLTLLAVFGRARYGRRVSDVGKAGLPAGGVMSTVSRL